jgi:UDP-N-acetylglucosamine 2-epimerase (non-hydrolysing)
MNGTGSIQEDPGGARQQKVACVVGTRPEVIKMFPVVQELKRQGLQTSLINTGQHKELSNEIFETFELIPDFDLATMVTNQSPTGLASLVLDRLEPILEKVEPDWLFVQGDTTSAMAGAIAGAYNKIPVAHVLQL